jgi:N-hydroxyarylamine O-acetyltransferase
MRLADYLHRVGVDRGSDPVDAEMLRRLHIAHREAFLFENVAIQTGGAIGVGVEQIEHKFLDQGSGGYCFEHNTLFGAVLRDLGLAVTALLGRVRRGPPERWCRTHMVLRVDIDGQAWLADVGFGAMGLLEPIPLVQGAASVQTGVAYALRRDGRLWVLSAALVGGDASAVAETQDLYEFSDDPQTPGDVEVANHYTATHPDSMFRRTLTIQRTSRHERTMLRQQVLTRFRNGRAEEEPVDRSQLATVVREVFGVELPAGGFVFETYPSRSG